MDYRDQVIGSEMRDLYCLSLRNCLLLMDDLIAAQPDDRRGQSGWLRLLGAVLILSRAEQCRWQLV